MRARPVFIALLVVVGIGGVVLLEWDLLRKHAARLRNAEREASSRTERAASSANASAADSASDQASNAQRQPIDDPKSEGDAPEEPPRIPVDGVVIVTDAEGIDHASEDGAFHPYFYEIDAARDPRRAPRFDCGDEIEVTHGHFHVDVPAGRRLGAGNLAVAGRGALVDSAPVDVRPGEPVSIRCHWPRGVRLRVVDSATNAELDQIDVIRRGNEIWSEWPLHPGTPPRGVVLVHHGASPVLLDPAVALLDPMVRSMPWEEGLEQEFWVGARDHAFAYVQVDFDGSAERTIELEAAATLVVEIQGPLPPAPPDAVSTRVVIGEDQEEHAMLRVRQYVKPLTFDEEIEPQLASIEAIPASDYPDGIKPTREELKRDWEKGRAAYEAREPRRGDLITELPAKSGTTRLEGLKAGEVSVCLEFGNTPLVRDAGQVTVTLVAGQTTHVTLVPDPVKEPRVDRRPRVPLAGTLFVASGWPLEKLELRVAANDSLASIDPNRERIALAEMSAITGRPGWYRWSAGSVTPGGYRFSVDVASFCRCREIDAGGDESVAIVLADAATVAIRFIDAAGTPLPSALSPTWIPDTGTDGPWTTLESWRELDRDPESQRYVATVPVGPGHVWLPFDNGALLDEETSHADIHPGSQELSVKLRSACGVTLQFKCGDAPVWWESDYGDIEFSTDDEESCWFNSTRNGRLRKYTVANPGLYRITIPRIPGFQAVPPVEVDIPAEKFITMTVELKRR